jgi:PTS system mannose-specific IIC component
MNGVEIGILSVLGAILGLDVVSFPQAMLSRPIVSATLTGALLGDPQRGVLLGATLECFALETLPVGASRYPEWGSSSVVGGALLAAAPVANGGALLLAVLATLSWAWVGGWSMVQLRRLNAHWARQRHDAVAEGSRRTVIGLQLYGLTADLLRGAAMTAAGLLIFVPLERLALARWASDQDLSRTLLVVLAAVVAAGAGYKVFHSVPGTRWIFATGLALGMLLLGLVR